MDGSLAFQSFSSKYFFTNGSMEPVIYISIIRKVFPLIGITIHLYILPFWHYTMLNMKLLHLTLFITVLLLSNNATSSNLSEAIPVNDLPSTDIIVAETLALDENFGSDDIWSDNHWSRSGEYYLVDETNGWLHKETAGTYEDWVMYTDYFTVPLSIELSGRLTSGGRDYTSPGIRLYMQNGSILGSGVYNSAGEWWTLMDSRP